MGKVGRTEFWSSEHKWENKDSILPTTNSQLLTQRINSIVQPKRLFPFDATSAFPARPFPALIAGPRGGEIHSQFETNSNNFIFSQMNERCFDLNFVPIGQ